MGHPECLDGARPFPVGWVLRARLRGRSALLEGVAELQQQKAWSVGAPVEPCPS